MPSVNEKAVFGIQTCSAPGLAAGAAAALETEADALAAELLVATVVVAAVVPDEVAAVETADVAADEAALLDAAVVDTALAAGALVAAAVLVVAGADVVVVAAPPQALRSATAPAGRMNAANACRRETREQGGQPKAIDVLLSMVMIAHHAPRSSIPAANTGGTTALGV